MADTHDPGVNPEDEGFPDLQSGTPQAQRASDPQQEPVPGDVPAASNKHGTTTLEQMEGESLDDKLAEEEPEESGPANFDTTEEAAGLLSDDPLQERPANQDFFSQVSPSHGLSAEEAAVYITDDLEAVDLEEIGRTEETEQPGEVDLPGGPEPEQP